MKKNRFTPLLIGFVYLTVFLLLSEYDFQISDFLTDYEVRAIVLLGARIGPLPAMLVPAYCFRTLDEWEDNRIFQLGSIGCALGGAFMAVVPDFSSMLDLLLLIIVWAGLFAFVRWLPIPDESERHRRVLYLGILITAVSFLLVQVMKFTWGRPRFVAVVNEGADFTEWFRIAGFALRDDYYRSFPSGHTVSASAIFFIVFLPDLFPSLEDHRTACWVIAITYTAFVAFTRIMAGMHFVSDVMAACGVYLLTYAVTMKIAEKKGYI